MPLVVQKFGGTSVATPELITRAASRIAATRQAGVDVIAVVSAMGSETDSLLQLARQVNPQPPARELDLLLTAGERISMSLLAMALDSEGIHAMSLTGSQAGILTVGDHGSAEIRDVRSFRVQEGLDEGKVVIVAGFQGVDPESKDVTTLGRGGSDVTAVALAAAHGAEHCEIYTDVDGVYSADPMMVNEAQLFPQVSFAEMVELAGAGGQVVMREAAEAALRYQVPLHVKSAFHDEGGTRIEEESAPIRAVAQDRRCVRLRAAGERDGKARARLMDRLGNEGIDADVVLSATSEFGMAVAEHTSDKAKLAVEEAFGAKVRTSRVAKVSLVGAGLSDTSALSAAVQQTISSSGIDSELLHPNFLRVSVLVDREASDDAVQVIHDRFVSRIEEPA